MFEVVSSDCGLPLVAFHLKDDPARSFDEFHISERLRMNGWTVPAYALANDNQVGVLRCFCVALGGRGGVPALRGRRLSRCVPSCSPLTSPAPAVSSSVLLLHLVLCTRLMTTQSHTHTHTNTTQDRKVLRIVCRWDLGPTMVNELLEDLTVRHHR